MRLVRVPICSSSVRGTPDRIIGCGSQSYPG
jgi:hypothetical protein